MMTEKEHHKIKHKFPPETAGRRMVKRVPIVHQNETLSDVKRMLFEKTESLSTINYIYVIDDEKRLIGVFSIKEIFRKPEDAKVSEVMEKRVVRARPHTDQEKVASLAIRRNFKSIPVVDKKNRFLGIVTSDTILNILHNEDIEDILHFAGIQKDGYLPTKTLNASAGALIRARIPWLMIGLVGGIIGAQIVNLFKGSLEENFILAAFIPLILYMAAAVGTQTQTLFIRGLAISHNLNIKNYFLREIKIGFFIALICGSLLSLISFVWLNTLHVGFILGVSMFLTIISAIFIAMGIPWFLNKLKKDPAIGAGPFGTAIQDIVSLIIYFSIATILFKLF